VFQRKTKYGSKQTRSSDGRSFQSCSERDLYELIKARQLAGEVELIQTQAKVSVCGPQGHSCDSKCKIEYWPDFKIREVASGEIIYEEMKGFATDVWRIKRRLWFHYGPGLLRVYGKNSRGVYLAEEIYPRS